MFKRTLIVLAASGLLVGLASPASADDAFGFDPYNVENPNGKEVAQTHAGVGDALGFDPWQVAGTYEPERNTEIAEQSEGSGDENPNLAHGYGYGDPAFGLQVGA